MKFYSAVKDNPDNSLRLFDVHDKKEMVFGSVESTNSEEKKDIE